MLLWKKEGKRFREKGRAAGNPRLQPIAFMDRASMDGSKIWASRMRIARIQNSLIKFSRANERCKFMLIDWYFCGDWLMGHSGKSAANHDGAAAARWRKIPRDNGWVISPTFGWNISREDSLPALDNHFCNHMYAKCIKRMLTNQATQTKP